MFNTLRAFLKRIYEWCCIILQRDTRHFNSHDQAQYHQWVLRHFRDQIPLPLRLNVMPDGGCVPVLEGACVPPMPAVPSRRVLCLHQDIHNHLRARSEQRIGFWKKHPFPDKYDVERMIIGYFLNFILEEMSTLGPETADIQKLEVRLGFLKSLLMQEEIKRHRDFYTLLRVIMAQFASCAEELRDQQMARGIQPKIDQLKREIEQSIGIILNYFIYLCCFSKIRINQFVLDLQAVARGYLYHKPDPRDSEPCKTDTECLLIQPLVAGVLLCLSKGFVGPDLQQAFTRVMKLWEQHLAPYLQEDALRSDLCLRDLSPVLWYQWVGHHTERGPFEPVVLRQAPDLRSLAELGKYLLLFFVGYKMLMELVYDGVDPSHQGQRLGAILRGFDETQRALDAFLAGNHWAELAQALQQHYPQAVLKAGAIEQYDQSLRECSARSVAVSRSLQGLLTARALQGPQYWVVYPNGFLPQVAGTPRRALGCNPAASPLRILGR
jgi:hypothetical protein